MSTRKEGKIPSAFNPFAPGFAGGIKFTVGAKVTNAINVAMQFTDGTTKACPGTAALPVYLSDNADGSTLTATVPSGGWAIGTNGLLITIVTNKAAFAVSKSTGQVDITITEASPQAYYLVVVLPDGSLVISPIIQF